MTNNTAAAFAATLAPKATDRLSGDTAVQVTKAFTDVRTRRSVAVVDGRQVPLARVTFA